MKIKKVSATIALETEGGRMDFVIEGPAKGVDSMSKLGDYLGKAVSSHLEAFVGVDRYNAAIIDLEAALRKQKLEVEALRQRLDDANDLAKAERVERLRAKAELDRTGTKKGEG